MQSEEYNNLLLKGSVLVMACDGEIHETEVEELTALGEKSIFFDGLDVDQKVSELASQIRNQGKLVSEAYFKELQSASLSETKKFNLVEVLLRIIASDGVIDENEVAFLKEVCHCLMIKNEDLIVRFPKFISYFLSKKSAITSYRFAEI